MLIRSVVRSAGINLPAALALLLAMPIFVVLASLFVPGSGDVWRHLWSTVLGLYAFNSLWLILSVACLSLLLGLPPAWIVTMYRFPGHRWVGLMLILPLSIPAYILGYVYGDGLQTLTMLPSTVRSMIGVVCALSLALYPYVYLICRTAFIDQPCCVLEAARTLGCGRTRAFFRVALPLARPAMVTGLALVMMETLSDYGTVHYFGLPVFTTGIFRAWYGMDNIWGANQLAAVLLFFVTALYLVERLGRRRLRYHSPTDRHLPLPTVSLYGYRAYGALAICLLPIILGFLLPCVVLLKWIGQTVDNGMYGDWVRSLWHSFSVAAVAATCTLILAGFLHYGRRIGGMLAVISIDVVRLGYAVPGMVIAIGLLSGFQLLLSSLVPLWPGSRDVWVFILTSTVVGLLFAYMARFTLIPLQLLENASGRIRPSLGEASRCLGLSPRAVFRRIHFPIMRGGALVGWLIVFVEVLKELPMTLLLRPFNFNTLAVRAHELAREERLSAAAWPALTIICICLPMVWLIGRHLSVARVGKEVNYATS